MAYVRGSATLLQTRDANQSHNIIQHTTMNIPYIDKYYYNYCRRGDLNAIKDIVSKGFNVNQADNEEGLTGLHYSSGNGHLRIVELLL